MRSTSILLVRRVGITRKNRSVERVVLYHTLQLQGYVSSDLWETRRRCSGSELSTCSTNLR